MNLQAREVMDYIEAAEFLGVSRRTLVSLVLRKGIPHFRIGRLVRFAKKDLTSWMTRKTTA